MTNLLAAFALSLLAPVPASAVAVTAVSLDASGSGVHVEVEYPACAANPSLRFELAQMRCYTALPTGHLQVRDQQGSAASCPSRARKSVQVNLAQLGMARLRCPGVRLYVTGESGSAQLVRLP